MMRYIRGSFRRDMERPLKGPIALVRSSSISLWYIACIWVERLREEVQNIKFGGKRCGKRQGFASTALDISTTYQGKG